MIINIGGSNLGSQVMLTGLPEALFKRFGEKVHLAGAIRRDLWKNNPFLTDNPCGKNIHLRTFQDRDRMVYSPVMRFYDITEQLFGQPWIVDREDVSPKLYYPKQERSKWLVIINDQAGWPSRTGYPYINELSKELMGRGFVVEYSHNTKFRNCNGEEPPREIKDYSVSSGDEPLVQIIEKLARCTLFIGYDSGLIHLAGALGTPNVYITGCLPSICAASDSCIFTTKLFHCRKCNQENCSMMCLENAIDQNDKIIEVIIAFFGEKRTSVPLLVQSH